MANGMRSMIAHQISEDIKHFSNRMMEKKNKRGIASESGSINTSGSAALMLNMVPSGHLHNNASPGGSLDTVPEGPELLKHSHFSVRHDENLSGDEYPSPNNPHRLESRRSRANTIKEHHH